MGGVDRNPISVVNGQGPPTTTPHPRRKVHQFHDVRGCWTSPGLGIGGVGGGDGIFALKYIIYMKLNVL